MVYRCPWSTNAPPVAARIDSRRARSLQPAPQYCWPRSQREQMSTWRRHRAHRNIRASSIAPPGGEGWTIRDHRAILYSEPYASAAPCDLTPTPQRRHLRIGNIDSGGKHVLGRSPGRFSACSVALRRSRQDLICTTYTHFLAAANNEVFAPSAAREVLCRLEFHFVPKHASWLNMVEIEIGGAPVSDILARPKRLQMLRRKMFCHAVDGQAHERGRRAQPRHLLLPRPFPAPPNPSLQGVNERLPQTSRAQPGASRPEDHHPSGRACGCRWPSRAQQPSSRAASETGPTTDDAEIVGTVVGTIGTRRATE